MSIRNLAITLLCSLAILLALALPSSATSPDSPHRRDHVNHNRMIKIRRAFPPVPRQHQVGANGAAAGPPADSPSSPIPSSTSSSPAPSDASQPSSASLSLQTSSSLALSASSPAVSFFRFT